MNQELKDKFLKEFPIPIGTKKEPYIILFDAFTGMGKSTVAREITKYDKSIILNNDEVRAWLTKHNENNLYKELQNYRLEELLKNRNSCIQDSCICHNWESKKAYFDSLGYKYYIIRIICSEKTIEERLSKRVVNEDNFSTATYKDYLWMKNNVSQVSDELIDYTINTEDDISKQVKEFLETYKLI